MLYTCTPSSSTYQTWTINQSTSYPTIYQNRAGTNFCVDIEDFATGENATVWTYQCGDGSSTNEFWTVSANSIQSNENPGQKCLRAGYTTDTNPVAVGTPITTATCSGQDSRQSLSFNSATGQIVHTPTGLCVDSGTPIDWCQSNGHSSWGICNTSLPIDERAADIVSRISLQDKIQALGTSTPALPSVGLPPYNWWSEATHGISHVTFDSLTPYASNTALPCTTSNSFNRTLWFKTGNQIAREARAFMNVNHAYSTYWAPVVNIVRDPRWGRIIEAGGGEDPFTLGEYARSFVLGFEHATETPYPLQASACCKHYVANSLDAWNGTDRYHVNAEVPMQDLVDSYLPAFQVCVEEGQVSSIMCSCE